MLPFSTKNLEEPLFYAMGSVRDTFSFDLMQEVAIPIPDIKVQKAIVEIHSSYIRRKTINERLKAQIKDICPILIKGSLEEENPSRRHGDHRVQETPCTPCLREEQERSLSRRHGDHRVQETPCTPCLREEQERSLSQRHGDHRVQETPCTPCLREKQEISHGDTEDTKGRNMI